MSKKLIIILLNIVIGIALIPVMMVFVNHAKVISVGIPINFTFDGYNITSDLSSNNKDLINIHRHNITNISNASILDTYKWEIPTVIPDDLIDIKAGDRLLFKYDMSVFQPRSSADRFQNIATTSMTDIWGWGIGATELFRVFYNSTYFDLVTGLWHTPSFNDVAYSDTWINWQPDPLTQTGILTFLQDFPQPIGYTYTTTGSTYFPFSSWLYNQPEDYWVLDQGFSTTSDYINTSQSDLILRYTPQPFSWDFDPADLLTTTIHIKTGDTITYNKNLTRPNVLYSEYLVSNTALTQDYFRIYGSGYELDYTTTQEPFIFEGGLYSSPTLAPDFSNAFFTWVVTGDTGVFTFLKDWEYPFNYVINSNDVSTPRYYWFNSKGLHTNALYETILPVSTIDFAFNDINLTMQVDDGSFTSDSYLTETTQEIIITMDIPNTPIMLGLLNVLPILFVVILIVSATIIIKKQN